ncbi:MAG: NAD(P)/FAD-dependent oxidoreductase [Alphaproteobacteria bacterium]|nr:NAD(P)/FAD-dependent oxidoreductase [Alphaproteobacteria bacterium]
MDYVVVGAGPAGVIAAETLRRADPSGAVTLIGDEPAAPYSRMAIPYLLAGDIEPAGTHLRHGTGHYRAHGIKVVKGRRVTRVAAKSRVLTLDDGAKVKYDKLLVATGSRPVRPPIKGIDLPGIESCWTLADAAAIARKAKPRSRVVLMGAGFIGCIILEALAARKVDLTVVEMADRMVARMMDRQGGDMIKRWCEGRGVKVLTSTRVEAIEKTKTGFRLAIGRRAALEADLVVCATGVAPNVEFLKGSGVETEFGILVDHGLRTSVPDIFAAGDVAQGPELITGKPEVHAIQPTASEHGRVAALNMAGVPSHYRGSLSMNVLNTLGLISSSFGHWQGLPGGEIAEASDPDHFCYLRLCFKDDRVVGALALGLTQHVGVIRGLVQTGLPLGPWKKALQRDPHQVMNAYLDLTKAVP